MHNWIEACTILFIIIQAAREYLASRKKDTGVKQENLPTSPAKQLKVPPVQRTGIKIANYNYLHTFISTYMQGKKEDDVEFAQAAQQMIAKYVICVLTNLNMVDLGKKSSAVQKESVLVYYHIVQNLYHS